MAAQETTRYDEIPMGLSRYLRLTFIPARRSQGRVAHVVIQVRNGCRLLRSAPKIPLAVAQCIGVTAQSLAYDSFARPRSRASRQQRPAHLTRRA